MKKIKFTADSTCDLSPELRERFGVSISPLYVILGDKSYKDGFDVVPDDIYDFVNANKTLPTTSASTVADYIEMFSTYTRQGYEVVHFNLSSGISATHQNAVIAAGEVGNVYVIDSKNLSTATSLLLIDALELAKEGRDAKEIYDIITARVGLVRASFVIDSLDYLRMGGRCSSVAALGANMLKIKPCIQVLDGKMDVGSKYRGPLDKVLLKYVEDKLTSTPNIITNRIFITHTGCSTEIIESVKNKINEIIKFDEIFDTVAGCVITSHCGPYTLGILFEVSE